MNLHNFIKNKKHVLNVLMVLVCVCVCMCVCVCVCVCVTLLPDVHLSPPT